MANDAYDVLMDGKRKIEGKRLDYEDKLAEDTAKEYSQAVKSTYMEIGEEERVEFVNDLENLLQKHFSVENPKNDDEIKKVLNMLVKDMDFSTRASSALGKMEITTVYELIEFGENALLSCRGFGKTCLRSVKRKLNDYGLRFGMNINKYSKK